jgi:RNA recognition motif-containing protein
MQTGAGATGGTGLHQSEYSSGVSTLVGSTDQLAQQNPHTTLEYDANQPPNSRLFVVCSKTLSETDIRDVFAAFGDIQDVYVIRDKTPARGSKGVCFIKFFKTSDACRAMEELNGKHIKDCERPIKVLIAQSRGADRGIPGYGSGRPPVGNGLMPHAEEDVENLLRLFVAVDKKSSSEEIKNYFAQFGLVDHVHILKDKESGDSRGVAYVKFYKASHAALALEGAASDYKAILADPRPPKSGGPMGVGGQNGGGHHYNGHPMPPQALLNMKTDPLMHHMHHPAFNGGHGAMGSHHPSHNGAAASFGSQQVGPMYPPHPLGAGLLPPPSAALMDDASGLGPAGQSHPPWMHAGDSNPAAFDHFNVACRTMGFSSCRIQAIVESSLSEEQLHPLFDIVPGMDSFHLSFDQRKGTSSGIAYVSYATPLSALYAREKLNGLEFPPGFRMIVKLIDDTNGPGRSAHVSQVLSNQMTRVMNFGLATMTGSLPAAGTSNGITKPVNGISNLGTGDNGQVDDMAASNAEDGMRSYLFPSAGGAGFSQQNMESYPSFTSSSSNGSNGSATVANGQSDATRKRRGNQPASSQNRYSTPNGWSYCCSVVLPKPSALSVNSAPVRSIHVQGTSKLPHVDVMQDVFCRFGNLIGVSSPSSPSPANSGGSGNNSTAAANVLFVVYCVQQSAEQAIRTVNNSTIDGCAIKLTLMDSPANSPPSRLM